MAGDLISQIEAILFAADPIGINFETNTDEYSPEAKTIASRLREAGTTDELLRIVQEEFIHWFGPEIAGAVERYRGIATSIWIISTAADDAAAVAPAESETDPPESP